MPHMPRDPLRDYKREAARVNAERRRRVADDIARDALLADLIGFLAPTLTSHISDYGIGRRELRTILRGSHKRGGLGTPFAPIEHTYLACAYIHGHDSVWQD
jgi:hypothetical protein